MAYLMATNMPLMGYWMLMMTPLTSTVVLRQMAVAALLVAASPQFTVALQSGSVTYLIQMS
jgi:hypothetical protein